MNGKNNLLIVKVKAVVSSIMLVLMVLVSFSGIALLFAPKRAGQLNWTFLGIPKETLLKMHNLPGVALIVFFVIHFILNLKLYISEMKALFK